ncbi:MAG: hypothetical protein A4E72_00155 [Syntrophus sp. PtaU1.Bin208]|nr:MAG: hypothetical protein A4E72_00155 [Syntrophus sp. PtaU1.Bin208]
MSNSEIWIRRLGDPAPQVRWEAIRQLEMIGDPVVLGPLAVVFAADPDPALRAFAQQVGKSIYYAAIRRTTETRQASAEERQKAADILAQAQARKQKRR